MTRNGRIADEFRNRIENPMNSSGREARIEALSPAGFRQAMGVSAATLERLAAYLALLRRWQKNINLVGKATLDDPWRRHFLDCAQLTALLPEAAETVIDVGAGAGFPGLVLAIMERDDGRPTGRPGRHVHLIESDQRKCVFLNEIIRLIGVQATVHECRAEVYTGPRGDVVTARACAPLARLAAWVAPLMAPGAIGLFAKGAGVDDELTFAAKDWKMDVVQHASHADSRGVILEVANLARRHDS